MPKKLSVEERNEIRRRLNRRYETLRKKYPEVHGKTVDFISHNIEDGTLYFTVRFTDKTAFALQYQCDLTPGGAELGDWKTGDFKLVRQY
jgi:hypothetical protein